MDNDTLIEAWRWWARRLRALDAAEAAVPTRCVGWDVHALAAHVAPPPDQIAALVERPLDATPDVVEASDLLRQFNRPGGVAESAAPMVADAAVATASATSIQDLADMFDRSADLVAVSPLGRDAVVAHPAGLTTTVGVVADVSTMEAVVHGLDLLDAVGGDPLPDDALRRARHVLVAVADPVAMVEVLAGRTDAKDVLPVVR